MVKIKDIGEERRAKEKRKERTSGLLKEVFGDKVEIRSIPIGINLREKKTDVFIGYVNYMQDIMELKEAGHEPEAMEFGKRFEDEIGVLYPNLVKDFIIETDYR